MNKQDVDKLFEQNPFLQVSEAVYCVLKDAIIHLRLRPNSKLNVNALANQLCTSRSPIRDALEQLLTEKLVFRAEEKKFYRVAPISPEDYIQILDARASIEAAAVDILRRRVTAGQLEELSRLQKRHDDLYTTEDLTASFDRDIDFHEAIVAFSRNQYLIEMYNRLLPKIRRYTYCNAYLATKKFSAAYDVNHIWDPVLTSRDHMGIFHAIRFNLPGNIRIVYEHIQRSHTMIEIYSLVDGMEGLSIF